MADIAEGNAMSVSTSCSRKARIMASKAVSVKITLPLPPNIGNSRMHWRVKLNRKNCYFEACALYEAMNVKGSDIYRGPHDRTRLKTTFYCGGRMDIDNAFARAKWPVDWLVRRGYLKGDSEKHLVWEMPVQVVKRNQQYRVEFELEAA